MRGGSMVNLSEMLDKTVENLDGESLGKVKKIAIDKESKKCVIITDAGCYLADKMAVDDVVTVCGERNVTLLCAPLSIGKAVYDTSAKYLGDLADCQLTQTLKLVNIALDNGERYARSKLYATGDIIIVKPEVPLKPRKPQNKKKPFAKEREKLATVYKAQAGANNLRNRHPQKKYGDFSFLIGKKVDKNITNFQGEIMLKYGEVITADVLRQAKISGKLIELCLHVQ